MTPNKEKLISKLEDAVIEYLDSRYDDHYQQQCVEMFEQEFSSLFKDQEAEAAKKLNKFASGILNEISKNVYTKNKQMIYAAIHKEISSLLDDLFSDTEAEEVLAFISTEVGRKLLRNLDLFREAYMAGTKELVGLTLKAWGDPQVGQMIISYMEKLEEENED